MIPAFDQDTGSLPPGIHEATWEEVVARYGTTSQRLALLSGLKRALDTLRAAGCQRAYLDGSFVTAKARPGDFDGCWEAHGVDPDLLDPVLLDFTYRRTAQKSAYGGEMFLAHGLADPFGTRFLEFFQHDAEGAPKGIIAINLGGLP